MRVAGYLRGPKPAWIDCLKPLEVVCDRCAERDVWRCSNHRESACRPCAGRYRRLVRDVAYSGMSQKRPESGSVVLVTFTSPSNLGQHCLRPGCHTRDGSCSHEKCRCTPPGGADLATWNAECGRNWNRLRTAMRRRHPGLEFFRSVEVQDGKRRTDGVGRGALHLHVIVHVPGGLMSVKHLQGLAMDAGFGHSVEVSTPMQAGSKAFAYYVSKYVVKACDERDAVPWRRTRSRVPDALATAVPDDRVESAALVALGDAATAVASLASWGTWRPVTVPPVWNPEGEYWSESADGYVDDWRAWSNVETRTLATHRNWSRSVGWGMSMSAARSASAEYAALKARQRRRAELLALGMVESVVDLLVPPEPPPDPL